MKRDTLAALAQFALEVKKSRFLARAFPLGASSDANALLRAHADVNATHNCWAWRFGEDYRSSDDGEPGGSAGRPIKLDERFEAQGLRLHLRLPAAMYPDLERHLRDLSRGSATLQPIENPSE